MSCGVKKDAGAAKGLRLKLWPDEKQPLHQIVYFGKKS
jgi:hypothetical protein